MGHKVHKMGGYEALEPLKGVLVESHPSLAWNDVYLRYQEAYDAEVAEIHQNMNLEEHEDDAAAEADQGAEKAESVSNIPPPPIA